MSELILVRHGQSIWNLQNRFTGWYDVELSENGLLEAKKAGELLVKNNIRIDFAYTSYLKRANSTLEILLENMNLENMDYTRSWELNERHYGSLTGLNKSEMNIKIIVEKLIDPFLKAGDLSISLREKGLIKEIKSDNTPVSYTHLTLPTKRIV